MSTPEPTRFYQTGTFAVGNRLLDPDAAAVQADPERANAITQGHRACQGCGEALGARYALDAALRATSGRLIATNATGCLEVFSTPFPESSWRLPWIHSLFANAARRGHRGRRGAARQGPHGRARGRARAATAAPSTSASRACRGCSSAATTCCTSATTTRRT